MVLRRAVPDTRAPRWLVLATRQIAARPAFAVLQVSALAVGLLALVLLVLLRTDLIGSWRQATPADAPNRFVINIQPDQARAVPRHAAGRRRAALRLVPDDPRPAGRRSTARRSAPRTSPTRARSAWSSASSTSATAPSCRCTTRSSPGAGPPTRPTRSSVEEGLARVAGPEARRPPALRHRRHPGRRPHHQPAQGRLGLDARQLLRDVPARVDARRAADLHQRLPRAGDEGLRQRAEPRHSRTSPTSTCRRRSRRSSGCSTR